VASNDQISDWLNSLNASAQNRIHEKERDLEEKIKRCKAKIEDSKNIERVRSDEEAEVRNLHNQFVALKTEVEKAIKARSYLSAIQKKLDNLKVTLENNQDRGNKDFLEKVYNDSTLSISADDTNAQIKKKLEAMKDKIDNFKVEVAREFEKAESKVRSSSEKLKAKEEQDDTIKNLKESIENIIVDCKDNHTVSKQVINAIKDLEIKSGINFLNDWLEPTLEDAINEKKRNVRAENFFSA